MMSRRALSAGTAPLAVTAHSRSVQKVRGSLSVWSRLNQDTAAGGASDATQLASANVFPAPGPALTKVNGFIAPLVSRSSSRGRRTRPGGTAGGTAFSINKECGCSGTRHPFRSPDAAC